MNIRRAVASSFLTTVPDGAERSDSYNSHFTPRRKEPPPQKRYHLERKLGGPKSLYIRFGEEKNRTPSETQTPTVLSIPSHLMTAGSRVRHRKPCPVTLRLTYP